MSSGETTIKEPRMLASRDGTPIALWRDGTGPALLLAHGASSDHAAFDRMLPWLEPHFQVWRYDRRGRGESSDSPGYDVEREAEDVLAVLDAIDRPAHVFAHSFGGVPVLRAALRGANVLRLAFYESPIPPLAAQRESLEAAATHMETLIARDEAEQAVLFLAERIVKLPASDIAAMRAAPTWPSRVRAAATLPRELRAIASYEFPPQSLAALTGRVCLLLGGDSPHEQADRARQFAALVPGTRIATLHGQGHQAPLTAPDALARELTAFFSA